MSELHPSPGLASSPWRFRSQVAWGYVRRNSIEVALFAALMSCPWLLWGDVFGRFTSLGSSDVPYVIVFDPSGFLRHGALLVSQGTLAGGTLYLIYVPLGVAAVVLQGLHLNVLLVLSGLALGAAFGGMTLLVREFLDASGLTSSRSLVVATGLLYALAPLVAENFWVNFLPRLELYAFVPVVVVFMLRFGRGGSAWLVIASGFVVFGIAGGLADIPGSLPVAVVVVIVVGLWIALVGATSVSIRRVLLRLVVGVSCIVAMNAVWIIPFVLLLLNGQHQVVAALSSAQRSDGVGLVKALARYMSLKDAASFQLSRSLFPLGGSPMLLTSGWLRALFWIGILPWCGILSIVPIGVLRKRAPIVSFAAFLSGCCLAILSVVFLGLVSMKIPGSVSLEDWLIVNVPGWLATRNFYETFAIPFVFVSALAFAVCTTIVRAAVVKVEIVDGLSWLLSGLLVLYGGQLLYGTYFRLPYFAGYNVRNASGGLPGSYQRLVSLVAANADKGAILSLPLSTTSWTILVRSHGSGRIDYIGQSPPFFIAGLVDYNGLDSFGPAVLGTVVSDAISSEQVQGVAALLRVLGVDWIISARVANVPNRVAGFLASGSPVASDTFGRLLPVASGFRLISSAGPYSLWERRSPLGSDGVGLVGGGHGRAFDALLTTVQGFPDVGGVFSGFCGDHVVRSSVSIVSLTGGYGASLSVRVPAKGSACNAVFNGVIGKTSATLWVRGGRVNNVAVDSVAQGMDLVRIPGNNATNPVDVVVRVHSSYRLHFWLAACLSGISIAVAAIYGIWCLVVVRRRRGSVGRAV